MEDRRDQARLFVKDLQLYVAPLDFVVAGEMEFAVSENAGHLSEFQPPKDNIETHYRQLFGRLHMLNSDLTTRRDVLRDLYRGLCEHPGEYTSDQLLDELQLRYDAQGLIRSKNILRDILQIAFRQQAFDYGEQSASLYTPVWLAPGINSEADFVSRAELDYLYAVIRSGLEIDYGELACIIVSDRAQEDYIHFLLDDLKKRGLVVRKGNNYHLPGRGVIPFQGDPALQVLIRDIELVQIPDGMTSSTETAHSLAKKAMMQRSQDFAASGHTYLLACRLQWEAVEKGDAGATVEDLRWFMASYASAIAGKLSQVNRDYTGSRPYYIAFFALVKEEDPLWSWMRGLINPMLSYYWANAARELEMNVSSWNQSMSSPAQIAFNAATNPNPDLRRLWQKITRELAEVNPGLLRRIANQIQMNRSDDPEYARIADQIDQIIASVNHD